VPPKGKKLKGTKHFAPLGPSAGKLFIVISTRLILWIDWLLCPSLCPAFLLMIEAGTRPNQVSFSFSFPLFLADFYTHRQSLCPPSKLTPALCAKSKAKQQCQMPAEDVDGDQCPPSDNCSNLDTYQAGV
jgi:hypothetical protein